MSVQTIYSNISHSISKPPIVSFVILGKDLFRELVPVKLLGFFFPKLFFVVQRLFSQVLII
jgi:hypothetical protein